MAKKSNAFSKVMNFLEGRKEVDPSDDATSRQSMNSRKEKSQAPASKGPFSPTPNAKKPPVALRRTARY